MKMNNSTLLAAAGLALAGVSSTTLALPFTGQNFRADTGYGTTDFFNILSSNVNATSTYTPLEPVADNNGDGSIDIDDFIGQFLGITDSADDGEVNSFLDGTTPITSLGIATSYRLHFDYEFTGTAFINDGSGLIPDGTIDSNGDGLIDNGFIPGTPPRGLDSILPNYTSGWITLIYEDLNGSVLGAGNTQQILSLNFNSASLSGENVVLNADVDYSWYADGTSSLVENFFEFENAINIDGTSYTHWYDIWSEGQDLAVPFEIATRSDFNIDPNLVPTYEPNTGLLARTANLNITTAAPIPVPGTLALLGLGLVGLGYAGRHRKTA